MCQNLKDLFFYISFEIPFHTVISNRPWPIILSFRLINLLVRTAIWIYRSISIVLINVCQNSKDFFYISFEIPFHTIISNRPWPIISLFRLINLLVRTAIWIYRSIVLINVCQNSKNFFYIFFEISFHIVTNRSWPIILSFRLINLLVRIAIWIYRSISIVLINVSKF